MSGTFSGEPPTYRGPNRTTGAGRGAPGGVDRTLPPSAGNGGADRLADIADAHRPAGIGPDIVQVHRHHSTQRS